MTEKRRTFWGAAFGLSRLSMDLFKPKKETSVQLSFSKRV